MSPLNYLHVAQAALDVSADLSAIHYAQLWCQAARTSAKRADSRRISSNAVDDMASGNASESLLNLLAADPQSGDLGVVCQRIVHEALKRLGQGDAQQGCGWKSLMSDSGRAERLLREGRFFDAVAVMDSTHGQNEELKGDLCDVLGEARLYGALRSVLNTTAASEKLASKRAECAWRLSQWEDLGEGGEAEDYHSCHALALRALVAPSNDGGHLGREEALAACDSWLSSALQCCLRERRGDSAAWMNQHLAKLRSVMDGKRVLCLVQSTLREINWLK